MTRSLHPVTRRLLALPWPVLASGAVLASIVAHGLGSWFIIQYRGEPLFVVWPGVGVGLAVLWLFGCAYWPWLLAGSLLAQWTSTGTFGFYTVLFPVVDTVEAWLGATLLLRSRTDVSFGRVGDVARYLVWAGLVPTLVGAGGGLAAAALLFGDSYYHDPVAWMHWWLADAQGMLHVATVLLTWACLPAPGSQRWPSWAWLPLLVAVAAVCTLVVRTTVADPFAPALFMLPVALVVTGAVAFGARGAATTSLLTTVILGLTLPYAALDEGAAVNFYAGVEMASLGLLLIALTLAALMTEVTAAADAREVMAAQLAETQRLDGLGRIAAGVAHDFNNLLTGILGNASLLRLRVGDAHAQQLLGEVEESSQRAAELCRQMLTIGGIGRRSPQRIDLVTLVEDMGRVLRASTRREIDLRFDLDATSAPIDADPTQARQVLMNLVANAAEACPAGHPHVVTVGVHRVDLTDAMAREAAATPPLDAGPHAVLSVTDTGTGMTEETAARIFDPFFTTKFAGRGLGLAVVLGIVRAHHAGVTVTSTPGVGTTMRVSWPMPAAAEAPVDVFRGQHVLMLMPDAASAQQARRLVSSLGGRGTTATTMAEAVGSMSAGAEAATVDLLLVDADAVRTATDIVRLRDRTGARHCIVAARDVSMFDEMPAGDRRALRLLQKPYGPRMLVAVAGRATTEISR